MMSADQAERLSASLGETANLVAMLTGIKQQYMDAGWSEHAAESMVHAMMMQQAGAK